MAEGEETFSATPPEPLREKKENDGGGEKGDMSVPSSPLLSLAKRMLR